MGDSPFERLARKFEGMEEAAAGEPESWGPGVHNQSASRSAARGEEAVHSGLFESGNGIADRSFSGSPILQNQTKSQFGSPDTSSPSPKHDKALKVLIARGEEQLARAHTREKQLIAEIEQNITVDEMRRAHRAEVTELKGQIHELNVYNLEQQDVSRRLKEKVEALTATMETTQTKQGIRLMDAEADVERLKNIVKDLKGLEAQHRGERDTAIAVRDKAESDLRAAERVALDRERRIGSLEQSLVDCQKELDTASDDLTIAAQLQDRHLQTTEELRRALDDAKAEINKLEREREDLREECAGLAQSVRTLQVSTVPTHDFSALDLAKSAIEQDHRILSEDRDTLILRFEALQRHFQEMEKTREEEKQKVGKAWEAAADAEDQLANLEQVFSDLEKKVAAKLVFPTPLGTPLPKMIFSGSPPLASPETKQSEKEAQLLPMGEEQIKKTTKRQITLRQGALSEEGLSAPKAGVHNAAMDELLHGISPLLERLEEEIGAIEASLRLVTYSARAMVGLQLVTSEGRNDKLAEEEGADKESEVLRPALRGLFQVLETGGQEDEAQGALVPVHTNIQEAELFELQREIQFLRSNSVPLDEYKRTVFEMYEERERERAQDIERDNLARQIWRLEFEADAGVILTCNSSDREAYAKLRDRADVLTNLVEGMRHDFVMSAQEKDEARRINVQVKRALQQSEAQKQMCEQENARLKHLLQRTSVSIQTAVGQETGRIMLLERSVLELEHERNSLIQRLEDAVKASEHARGEGDSSVIKELEYRLEQSDLVHARDRLEADEKHREQVKALKASLDRRDDEIRALREEQERLTKAMQTAKELFQEEAANLADFEKLRAEVETGRVLVNRQAQELRAWQQRVTDASERESNLANQIEGLQLSLLHAHGNPHFQIPPKLPQHAPNVASNHAAPSYQHSALPANRNSEAPPPTRSIPFSPGREPIIITNSPHNSRETSPLRLSPPAPSLHMDVATFRHYRESLSPPKVQNSGPLQAPETVQPPQSFSELVDQFLVTQQAQGGAPQRAAEHHAHAPLLLPPLPEATLNREQGRKPHAGATEDAISSSSSRRREELKMMWRRSKGRDQARP